MAEPLGHWRRSHTCGELRLEDVGKQVTLMGWVGKRRDHGGVIFVDLRDRTGITQAVFRPDVNPAVHAKAEAIRGEYVLAVQGKVEPRPEGMANPKLPTGAIDVECTELLILSEAETPPFPIEPDVEVNEELRLRYRYLDLRRTNMQEVLALRHRVSQATRRYLSDRGFLEIETPFLMKSTPEGARDYLVPSRVSPGHFYALPQSPQTYKQLLMVAGFERYFQIVRCFRDEDLRGDRQPEFTQIDIEMSFVDEDDVMGLAEALTLHLFREILGVEIAGPIPRLTYQEAMDRYGVDRPDTRYGLEIVDLRQAALMSEFQVFRSVLDSEGQVRGINAKGCADYSRKQIDDLTAFAGRFGAKGLAWIKVTDQGLESSIVKFFPEAAQEQLRASLEAEPGDLLLFVADRPETVALVLGNLRQELARQLGLVDDEEYSFRWVTRFPLVEWDTEEKRYAAVHHPFTSPLEEDLDLLESDPASACARAYDLVLNGNEIAGGSIRIHLRDVQDRVFRLLGISPEEAEKKFGHLTTAFSYGAPPHGGIAFGYDRLIALMAGLEHIRDVIAFPKTNTASSPMDGAPSEVDTIQLRELGLRIL
ncbi:MAG: aspartate--tRNA ligase [Candidatus Latescibacteria bacterium]|nr:aspartate--tRNA ligase [Candidatus Latescibacterota bacterium]